MRQLLLQPRLQLISDLVPYGARLADIGTDHGYLPVSLLQRHAILSAIASDIGEEPLQHARRTAAEYEIEEIDFRLCAGLSAIQPSEVDTIVIAGMGGETIAAILEAAPWTLDGAHLLLLQPMTKVEFLRKWLSEKEYCFTLERLAFDKEHLYPIMLLQGREQRRLTQAEIYGGIELDKDPLYAAYLDERIVRLHRSYTGLLHSSDTADHEKAMQIKLLIGDLQRKREGL